MSYDAIVVGARCAGAPIGMLLAQRGYKVLLIEANTVPSDMPMSTHLIWQSGAAHLRRWDLLDRIVESNCPAIRTWELDFGPIKLLGEPLGMDGILDAYAPRRIILDRILVEAAMAAGVELRAGSKVTGLVHEGDSVTGVRATANDIAFQERARITIGADGRNSLVAKVVGASSYNDVSPLQGTYFAYWRNVAITGGELYVRERRCVYAWPTNDCLTLVGVNWTATDFPAVSVNIRGSYIDVVASCAPGLHSRLAEGTQEGRFIGGAVSNFMRKPFGPGWALVGDAGLTMDPCTAAGINNAFRDVEILAEAIDDGMSGRKPMLEALAVYHSRRDERVAPIYQFACQLAPFAPPPPDMLQLFAALASNPAETKRFLSVFAQTVSPQEFFAPENLQSIMAAESRSH
jgi:2-polyprenyl-6-methoxyphenol hydroxylase-like FAD-dependent oxidoreductase